MYLPELDNSLTRAEFQDGKAMKGKFYMVYIMRCSRTMEEFNTRGLPWMAGTQVT